MTDKIDDAKRTAQEVEQQLAAAAAKLADVIRNRAEIAFDAIVAHDEAATKKLADINEVEVALRREQVLLAACLDTARQKVTNAERETVAAAEAERAAQRQTRFSALRERAVALDRIATDLTAAFTDFQKEAAAIGRLATGSSAPSVELVSVGTRRALAAHLRATGLPLQAIPPSQRLSFASLAQSWSGTTSADENTATAA